MGIEVIISDENGVSIDRKETTAKLLRLEYYLSRVNKRQEQLRQTLKQKRGSGDDNEAVIKQGLRVLGVESGIKENQ